MKKPAKPKPKRRAKVQAPKPAQAKAAAARQHGASSGAQRPKPTRKQPPSLTARVALAPARGAAPSSLRARTSALVDIGYSSEDRQTLALLLLPLLILAASLGLNQTWKYALPTLTEIAAHAPASFERSATPRPGPPPVPMAPPEVSPAGSLAYPSAAPQIGTAAVPTNALDYPASVPSIDAPPAQRTDVAAWSPARPSWLDRLAAPPAIELARPETAPVVPAPLAPVPWPGPRLSAEDLCTPTPARLAAFSATGRFSRAPRMPIADSSDPAAFGLKLAAAARAQAGDLVVYSARYHPMSFPMGDMPSFYGACTDVIIRAYRALGIDLQELVQRTRSGRGDPNIDHRRTETLRTFFVRQGASLPITTFPEDYKPGDIVTYHRPFSRVSNSHIAIVSDVLAPTGRPMIVHNRGWGPQLEDALFVDRITGHYRYLGKPSLPSAEPSTEVARARAPRDLLQATYAGPALSYRRVVRNHDSASAGGVEHAARPAKAVIAPH